MTYMTLTQIERTYKNHGQHKEQMVAFAVTGEIRKHNRIRFDIESDIPEISASVKSAKFTLSQRVNGETKEEQITDFFNRTVSKTYIYVSNDFKAVIMNPNEFKEFLEKFCTLTTASQKCGGMKVLKMRSETNEVRQYLGLEIIPRKKRSK